VSQSNIIWNDIIIACHLGLKISQYFDTYKKWFYDKVTPVVLAIYIHKA